MVQGDLIEAVKAGKLTSVMELIASGADVNQQDRHGWTALCWAAGRGDMAIIRALAENGADVLKTGIDQRSPAMIAIAAGQVDAARFLLQVEAARPDYSAQRLRQYCAALHMKDLRQFPGWQESGAEGSGSQGAPLEDPLSNGAIVYLHQDFHVTRSIWPREEVIFDHDTPEWRRFCREVLRFAAPADLDLIGAAQRSTAVSGEAA
jgi:ankyrin repeat protein